jgi:hypothetical protein
MYECTVAIRAWIYERLKSPGIDSKESTPPAYVAWRSGLSNRVAGLTGPPCWESVPGLLKSKGLKIRARDSVTLTFCLTLPLSQPLKICTITLYLYSSVHELIHSLYYINLLYYIIPTVALLCIACRFLLNPHIRLGDDVSLINFSLNIVFLGFHIPYMFCPSDDMPLNDVSRPCGREAVVMWGL